ncbi:terminase small subunit [Escherichia coli]|nr:terminase small subunit [Escherichia coli]
MPETPLKWWKPHSVLSCCRGSQVKLPVFSTGSPCRCSGVFPELENRHVDFLKRDIIKAMNKAAALDELIPGLLSEYIEQSG